MAFRAGVNIVMYTLTGNYKADQVHVPALAGTAGAIGAHVNFGIAFAPLVPAYVVWAAFAVVALIVIALLLLARSRGAAMRALALALMVLALANPSFTREDREPIPSVAAVVVDKSPSQNFGDRAQADRSGARGALPSGSAAFPASRCASSKPDEADGETDGTRLFSALDAHRSPTCRPTASPAPS